MSNNYTDKESYRFHEEDVPDRCFNCKYQSERMLIMRHVESMMLIHLCPDCMLEHPSEYLLDNTRPWIGEKGKI